jgi:acyl carrier protein
MSDAELAEIRNEILNFLRSYTSLGPIEPDTDLLESDVLESLLLMDLLLHLEPKFPARLQGSDITPAHFRTVSSIALLIRGKLQEAGHPE